MSLQINDRLLWPGGKRKALTLSYDDGISQDRRLLKLLNEQGVKCTFNLNSGLLGMEGRVSAGKKEVSHNKIGKEEIVSLYAGHEIASHGRFHTSLTGMDSARCVQEILPCRQELEEITGQPLTGYAYAFGAFDDTIISALKSCGIVYARTIEATHRFDIPSDFFRWNPTCHHDDENLSGLVKEFLSDDKYFSFYSPAKLFFLWGHSYEFDQNDNWEHMEGFIKETAGREDVYYATNAEICQYVEAYRRLVFSADSSMVYNPSCITLWLGGTFTEETLEVKPGAIVKLQEPVDM